MHDLDKIIGLINKLSAYTADNCTAGEFEAAQLKIQDLITRYQIDTAEVRTDDDITCEYVSMPANTGMLSVLLNTIAKHNFCKVLRYNDACMIYGYYDDIQICVSLYALLALDMQLSHDRNKPKPVEPGWSKSFYLGYSVGLGDRLREAKQSAINTVQSTDTSVELSVKSKQHAIEEFYQGLDAKPSSKYTTSSSSTGYISGHASGLNADIGQTRIEE